MTKVHMFWEGILTKRQVASMISFRELGFDVNFWSYQDYPIPGGITKRDAGQILPYGSLDSYTFTHAFRKKKNGSEEAKYTAMSDIIRFRILKSEDGWWSDCDVICLKDSASFDELYKSRNNICAGFVWRSEVNSGVMSFPNKAIAEMISIETDNVLSSNKHIGLGELNLQAMNSVIEREGLIDEIFPSNFFYPSTDGLEAFWSSSRGDIDALAELSKDSYTVHWSNSFTHKYDSNGSSFIEQLFLKLPQKELDNYSY